MENAGQDPAGQQAQAGTQQPAADSQQAQSGSEGKGYKALYEDAVKESRFDYQLDRHCSKTQETHGGRTRQKVKAPKTCLKTRSS